MANGVQTAVQAEENVKQADREDARIEAPQDRNGQDTLVAKLGRKFISRYRKDLEALARK